MDDNHDGTFSIYYMVKDIGEYTLSIKFGGQPVPDGFYTFTVSQIFVYQFFSFGIPIMTKIVCINPSSHSLLKKYTTI